MKTEKQAVFSDTKGSIVKEKFLSYYVSIHTNWMKEMYYTTWKQLTSGSSLKLSHSSSFKAAKLAVVLSSISLSLLSLGMPSTVQVHNEKKNHFYLLTLWQKTKNKYASYTQTLLTYDNLCGKFFKAKRSHIKSQYLFKRKKKETIWRL